MVELKALTCAKHVFFHHDCTDCNAVREGFLDIHARWAAEHRANLDRLNAMGACPECGKLLCRCKGVVAAARR